MEQTKKQTAVEWFIKQLNKNPLPQSKDEFIDGDLVDIINKAKEMEKQQIIDAFKRGTINEMNGIEEINSEEYYNDYLNKTNEK